MWFCGTVARMWLVLIVDKFFSQPSMCICTVWRPWFSKRWKETLTLEVFVRQNRWRECKLSLTCMKNLYYWYGYSYVLRTGRNDKLNMCSYNIIHTCRYCLYWENIKCLYLYCESFNICNIKCNLEFPKTWFFQRLVLVSEMCPLAYCCRMCSICQ